MSQVHRGPDFASVDTGDVAVVSVEELHPLIAVLIDFMGKMFNNRNTEPERFAAISK